MTAYRKWMITCAVFISVFLLVGAITAGAEKSEAEESIFLVRDNNGKVFVYSGKNEMPRETEIWVNLLPSADRELLKKGIEAKSAEELIKLLEDLNS